MRIIPVLFVLFIGFGVYAQSQDATETAKEEPATGPKIEFEEKLHEFGDITQGDRVEYTFKYKNTGTEPLLLASVRTTCGCTAPNWSRDPLAPGESADLIVRFNSTGKMGMQNKVITINSNATNSIEKVKITANVLPKAPVATEETEKEATP
ncbi:DUF1573 domain-containing protein [Marinoscillum sp. MHG1-6]|uniref:DUF1573 domain-containing protein n=1 Tax=Marinoscillum sp. MHG1-6 TaxID=2959627 RepID=UPI002157AF52|nr:DUF1573 domain-containing protein [Marinoscillum sp. MHG1-6]